MPIRILDAATVGRIAAGEVIERPASIAKELIENALDAGSSSITVEIREGGIDYIRVTDNGCGLSPEETRIAFENHATSKISSGDELTDILTLYIDDLCVDEAARGHGVGRALYEHAKAFAKDSGCYNLTLNVWAGNDSAHRFYEAMGMKPQKYGMETIL